MIGIIASSGSAGGGGAFDPATLFTGGIMGAWYDPSDLASMWQDSGGTTAAAVDSPVGKINDKSGNGYHATQATSSKRPILRQSGSLYYLEFDGVDDRLDTSTSLTATQPWERLSGLRQVGWTNGEWIFTSTGAVTGLLAQGEGAASPNLGMYSGTTVLHHSGAAIGTDVVVEERHNGASSRIRVDSASYTTGNAGSTNVSGGFDIGDVGGGTRAVNIRLYSYIQRNGTWTAGELSDARTHVAAKTGATL